MIIDILKINKNIIITMILPFLNFLYSNSIFKKLVFTIFLLLLLIILVIIEDDDNDDVDVDVEIL